MTIADKLVLQRQHHLKWRSLDRLELVLMIVCGVLCFGFSLSVMCDIVTRTIGHPWLWLQEVTSTLFIYAIFIGAAVATRRNDHLYLTAISEALHGTPRLIVEIIIRLVVLGVAFCLIWFGYHQLSQGLWQFPAAVGHADRLALCGDPALRRSDRAVHDRATGQRHPQRLRPSGAAGRGASDPAGRHRRREGGAAVSAPVILALMSFCFLFFGYLGVPVPFSLMAGVFVGAMLDRRFAGGDHPEDFRWRGFRSAAGDPVFPAGRRTHEFGQCGGADRQSVAVAGRAYQGRPVAGRRRLQHVLLGNVGIDHRRRRGDEPRAGRPDEAGGLQPRLHRGDHRIRFHHRGAGAAEHHRRGLWRGRQRLDRRPVHGGRGARVDDRLRPDDLLLFLRPLRHAQAAGAVASGGVRRWRRGAAADDPGDPARRHSDRLVHADRGRRGRGGVDHRGRDPCAQSRASAQDPLRFLPRRADLLAAADHDRRRQRVRLDAGLSARRHRDRRLDHLDRRQRPAY